MNKVNVSAVSLLMVLLWSVLACRNDRNDDLLEQLIGRWEIEEAYRSGRLTESLAELYFEFLPNGKLLTNIAGMPEEVAYELSGKKILQRNGQIDVEYQVESIEADNLVLTTNLRNYAFRFVLSRAPDIEANEPLQ